MTKKEEQKFNALFKKIFKTGVPVDSKTLPRGVKVPGSDVTVMIPVSSLLTHLNEFVKAYEDVSK